jgi:hypothetical protein
LAAKQVALCYFAILLFCYFAILLFFAIFCYFAISGEKPGAT